MTPQRFKELMNEVKAETGVKGKELFHPVRIILTGAHSGPEFDKLIPLFEDGSRLDLPAHVLSVRERVEAFVDTTWCLTPPFAHDWEAEVLASRPLILPARQFVYPAQVEEVERGALEIMIRPSWGRAPFLATCALGFAGADVPTGVWACPDPAWICAVAGGYAYLIDTSDPARWEQVVYRPVTAVTAVAEHDLLVFSELSFAARLGPRREGLANRPAQLGWHAHYRYSRRNAAGAWDGT